MQEYPRPSPIAFLVGAVLGIFVTIVLYMVVTHTGPVCPL